MVNKYDISSYADYVNILCSSYLLFLYSCAWFSYVPVSVLTEISLETTDELQ
jgi:hypothetical protein